MCEIRAFLAAARREWRSVRRYPDTAVGSMLWPLIVPVVWVFEVKAFGGGHFSGGRLGHHLGFAQVAGFLYIGWLVASWVNLMLGEMSTSLQAQLQQGTLESALLSPSSRISLLFGPAPVYVGLGLLTYGAVAATVAAAFGVDITAGGLAEGALVMLLAGPAVAALGALLSTTVVLMRSTGGLVECVRAVFAALCGFTFPLAVLPAWAAHISRLLPPTWVTRDLRVAVLGMPGVVRWQALAVELLAVTVVLTAAALEAFGLAEYRARRTGHLGAY